MTNFLNFLKNINLNGYTLIIPSVSVGNVGQLTVDLLISTYNLEKIGTFWHPAIIASVGADPFKDENEDICVACELYVNEKLKLAAVQLRSSIEFKLALNFFKEFKTFILKNEFEKVLILTSAFAHLLNDPKLIYRCLSNDEELFDTLKALDFRFYEETRNGHIAEGSGFSVKFYETLNDSVKSTLLVNYVSEGDNRHDAVDMLNKLRRLINSLRNIDMDLKYPQSWNFVFGNPSPITIF